MVRAMNDILVVAVVAFVVGVALAVMWRDQHPPRQPEWHARGQRPARGIHGSAYASGPGGYVYTEVGGTVVRRPFPWDTVIVVSLVVVVTVAAVTGWIPAEILTSSCSITPQGQIGPHRVIIPPNKSRCITEHPGPYVLEIKAGQTLFVRTTTSVAVEVRDPWGSPMVPLPDGTSWQISRDGDYVVTQLGAESPHYSISFNIPAPGALP